MCRGTPAPLEMLSAGAEKLELQEMRERLKAKFQSSLIDGGLSRAFAIMRKEKEAQQLEEMRQSMKQKFQGAIANGTLSSIMSQMADSKEKRSSCIGDSCMPIDNCSESSLMEADQAAASYSHLIHTRRHVRKTLTEALFDGRLFDVVSSIKREKEARQMDGLTNKSPNILLAAAKEDHLEATFDGQIQMGQSPVSLVHAATGEASATIQNAMNDFNSSLLHTVLPESLPKMATETLHEGLANECLTEPVATQKQEKEAGAMEDFRQNTHKVFKNALGNGSLLAALANLKQKRETEELEKVRRNAQRILQSSLVDGRLEAAVSARKAEKDAVETTRRQVKATLQSSLADGRLFEVMAQMKIDKEANRFGVQDAHVKEVPTHEAVVNSPKPTKPTTAKTATRPPRRSSSRSASAAVAMEVTNLRQAAVSVSSAITVEKIAPAETTEFLPAEMSTTAANRKPDQENHKGALQTQSPQLASLERLPLSLSHLTELAPPASPKCGLPPVLPPIKQSASALARTLQRRPSGPSAMDLDLGLSSSTFSVQHPAFNGKENARDAFMDSQYPLHASSSMMTVTAAKTAKKQAPVLLPPISGSTSKFSTHAWSSPMDGFAWGVAPVVKSEVEWGM